MNTEWHTTQKMLLFAALAEQTKTHNKIKNFVVSQEKFSTDLLTTFALVKPVNRHTIKCFYYKTISIMYLVVQLCYYGTN